MVHMRKMISPGTFFHLFEILIFWIFGQVKGQKMTHNYQFQAVTLYVSQNCRSDLIMKIFGGTQV